MNNDKKVILFMATCVTIGFVSNLVKSTIRLPESIKPVEAKVFQSLPQRPLGEAIGVKIEKPRTNKPKEDVIVKEGFNETEYKEIIIGAGLAKTTKNFCNIRFTGKYVQKSLGATKYKGFAKFKTEHEGYEACKWMLEQYQISKKNYTIKTMIERYAPSVENNTTLYVDQIAGWLGKDKNTKVSDIDLHELVKVFAKKESSTIIR